MRKTFLTFLILGLGLILVACSAAPTPPVPTPIQPTPEPAAVSTGMSMLTGTVSDTQGAVTVDITPADFSADTLTFDISLNTHSVDLSMDLSTLATLSTDTGVAVQASLWDAPRGGHHVAGTLQFPASVDGKPVLEGAKQITIKIVKLDAPERVFTWDLP